jgi:hypothetical protein
MVVAATAQPYAVAFLFALSFSCCMAGAALRRWPDEVKAYMDRMDGSLLFVSPATHRALIQAVGVTLTGLSLVALVAAAFIA